MSLPPKQLLAGDVSSESCSQSPLTLGGTWEQEHALIPRRCKAPLQGAPSRWICWSREPDALRGRRKTRKLCRSLNHKELGLVLSAQGGQKLQWIDKVRLEHAVGKGPE